MNIENSLQIAAEKFNLTLLGHVSFGWHKKSAGSRATAQNKNFWLHVEPSQGSSSNQRGDKDANQVRNVKKPDFLKDETFEAYGVAWYAVLSTFIDEPTVSKTPDLTKPFIPSRQWLESLENSLRNLMLTPTTRVNTRQDLVDRRIKERFGNNIETKIEHWTTCHGDIHWANLTEKSPYLLDWEAWGIGPQGLDPAFLFCYSLSQPNTAKLIEEHFQTALSSRDGLVSQLFVCAELLRMSELHGDHLLLKDPLLLKSKALIAHLER